MVAGKYDQEIESLREQMMALGSKLQNLEGERDETIGNMESHLRDIKKRVLELEREDRTTPESLPNGH